MALLFDPGFAAHGLAQFFLSFVSRFATHANSKLLLLLRTFWDAENHCRHEAVRSITQTTCFGQAKHIASGQDYWIHWSNLHKTRRDMASTISADEYLEGHVTTANVSVLFDATDTAGFGSTLVDLIAGLLLTFISLVEQILIFLVIAMDSRLQTPSNYFVVSLAIADFLLTIFSLPLVATTYLHKQRVPRVVCELWAILDFGTTFVSIHTILFVSIERYRSIRDPLKHRATFTARRMIIWLIGIWILDITFWGALVIPTQEIYRKEEYGNLCIIYFMYESHFGPLLMGADIVLSVAVTIFAYVLIYFIVRRSGTIKSQNYQVPVTKGENTDSWSGSESTVSTIVGKVPSAQNLPSSESTLSTSAGDMVQVKSEKRKSEVPTGRVKNDRNLKTLRTIALLLAVFTICWLPMGIQTLIYGITGKLEDNLVGTISMWLTFCNSVLNPICYSIGNRKFRETLTKILCLRCRQKWQKFLTVRECVCCQLTALRCQKITKPCHEIHCEWSSRQSVSCVKTSVAVVNF